MEETERNERKHSDAPKRKREKQQGAGLGIGRALGRSAARVRPGDQEREQRAERGLQREDYTKPGHPALNAWLGLGGVVGTARAPGTGGAQATWTDTWGLTHRNGALWIAWESLSGDNGGAGREEAR